MKILSTFTATDEKGVSYEMPREVQLTDDEIAAVHTWYDLLDRGLGIYEATAQVRIAHPGLDDEFYSKWLGEPQ